MPTAARACATNSRRGACTPRRIASPGSCAKLGCKPVPGVPTARARPSPIIVPTLHPTCWLRSRAPSAVGTHLVSDITYIPTREGWLYLAVVIDLFSRAILGWKIADSLHATIVSDSLRQASANRPNSLRCHLPLRSRMPIQRHLHPRTPRTQSSPTEHERPRLLL